MRDWTAHVSARLAALGLDAEREAEIRAELSAHLEDAYADAVRRGCSEEDAAARALQQVPDWTYLADAIRDANLKDGPMSHDAKTLWLPGMAALGASAAVLLGTARLLPGSVWLDPGARLPMMSAMLLSYLLCGALGAWWSRRAGGGVAARFVAGIFPLALHLAIIIMAIAASLLAATLGRPDHVGRVSQIGVALGFVILPGFALTVGALPFLRDTATSSAPSGTPDLPTRG